MKWHRDDRSVRSCTRVVFWLVRRRSRTCLLTPPRYVRTISHATLFKERETQTGVGRRWGGIGYNREESRYPTTMLNLSKTPLITAPSILPILFLSLSLYSFSSSASVCSSTPAPPPPQPPAPANDLQEVTWLAWQSWEPQPAAGARHARSPALQHRWGASFVCRHLLFSFNATCCPFKLVMWHHWFCSVHSGKGARRTVK